VLVLHTGRRRPIRPVLPDIVQSIASSISSCPTAPGRRRTGVFVRSRTVDSRPIRLLPESRTAAIRPSKSSRTCLLLWDLVSRKGSLMGPRVGHYSLSSNRMVGILTAIVFSPEVTPPATGGLSQQVRGPGMETGWDQNGSGRDSRSDHATECR
jgi:hypothetical protein